MKCQACSIENSEDARFCGGCGNPLIHTVIDDHAYVESGTSTSVNFSDAVTLGFSQYATFRGRSTRAEFWWWSLFIVAVSGGFDVVEGFAPIIGMLGLLFELVVIVPSLAVGARRLHDINRSGWWQLLWLALFVGWIILIVWAVKPSDQGGNEYGMASGGATRGTNDHQWRGR